MYKFRLFSRKKPFRRRQYYFSFNYGGKVMSQSEGYNNEADRDAAVASIKRNAAGAPCVYATESDKYGHKDE